MSPEYLIWLVASNKLLSVKLLFRINLQFSANVVLWYIFACDWTLSFSFVRFHGRTNALYEIVGYIDFKSDVNNHYFDKELLSIASKYYEFFTEI